MNSNGNTLKILNKKILQHSKKNVLQNLDRWWKKDRLAYAMLAPFVILLFIFKILPVFVSLGYSLTNFNMIQPLNWIGIENYRMLFVDDDIFLIALRNTLFFAFVSGPIGYVMSLMMAWVINTLIFKKFFALAFYAPSICSGVAMSYVWLWFFSPDTYGFLNYNLIKFNIITEPILWNRDPTFIMPVIIFVSIWMSMGTGFLVFLAGFQNIPKDLYEAAKIDGINSHFQQLWYITLPLMKPQLLFGAITSIVAAFSVSSISTAIAGNPSPNYAGHTIVVHMHDYAFIRFQMGYATAVAIVLFAIIFLMGKLVMKLLRSD